MLLYRKNEIMLLGAVTPLESKKRQKIHVTCDAWENQRHFLTKCGHASSPNSGAYSKPS